MRKRAGSSWQNWAGNQQATASAVAQPASTDEVAAVVRSAAAAGAAVKPVGSGHSFTPAAATTGIMVDLSNLAGLVTPSRASKLIRVKAGTQLSALNVELARHGLAMPNLGDIDVQTVSGALATGTHGTGAGYGCLSTFVTELELVTGTGDVVRCSRDKNPDLFSAALVGVGAVGVVTEVTLRCVDAFVLHADERPTPLADVLAGLTTTSRATTTSSSTGCPTPRRPSPRPTTGYRSDDKPRGRLSSLVQRRPAGEHALGAVCRLCRAVPSWTPTLLRTTASAFSPRVYTERSDLVFTSPRRVRFVEMEYGLPRAALPEAFAGAPTDHRPAADQGVLPGRGAVHRRRRHLALPRVWARQRLHRHPPVRRHAVRAVLPGVRGGLQRRWAAGRTGARCTTAPPSRCAPSTRTSTTSSRCATSSTRTGVFANDYTRQIFGPWAPHSDARSARACTGQISEDSSEFSHALSRIVGVSRRRPAWRRWGRLLGGGLLGRGGLLGAAVFFAAAFLAAFFGAAALAAVDFAGGWPACAAALGPWPASRPASRSPARPSAPRSSDRGAGTRSSRRR